MAARLVAAVQLRQATFVFMTVGLISLLIADTIYGILGSAGTFQTGGFADAFWLGFYGLIGAGALHPSMGGAIEARDTNARHDHQAAARPCCSSSSSPSR